MPALKSHQQYRDDALEQATKIDQYLKATDILPHRRAQAEHDQVYYLHLASKHEGYMT